MVAEEAVPAQNPDLFGKFRPPLAEVIEILTNEDEKSEYRQ
jgi:hypothetical protein